MGLLAAWVLTLSSESVLEGYRQAYVWPGRVDGVYFKGEVFSAVGGHDRNGVHDATLVNRGTYTGRVRIRDPIETFFYLGEPSEVHDFRLRLQIRDNTLLVAMNTRYTIPLGELALVEPGPLGEIQFDYFLKPAKRGGLLDIGERYKTDAFDVLFPPHRPPDRVAVDPPRDQIPEFNDEGARRIQQKAYTEVVRMDTRLIDKDTVRLYHAFDGKLVISNEPNDLPNKPGAKKRPVPPRNLRSGKTPPEFVGKFDSHETKDGTFLLTQQGGRLYRVVPKGKDGLELVEVWRDKECVTIGVVTFAEKEKCYLFGYAGKRTEPERFLFELSSEPKLKKYKITFQPAKDPDDSFREVYDCIRALENNK